MATYCNSFQFGFISSFAGQESVRNALANTHRCPGRSIRIYGTERLATTQQVDPGAQQRNATVRDDHRQE